MLTLVASVIIFGLLVFFHELGHYLAAKNAGIGVLEFALGFGPKLISKEINATIYSLRAFPLGGFVRLAGEDPEESVREDSFQKQPVWKRFTVIAAGPLMNFVLAIILFSLIYFAFLGVPDYDSTVIGKVLPGGQAETVGLQAGDRIISVAGQEVNKWQELVAVIHAHPEREIEIVFARNDTIQQVTVTPVRDEQTGNGLIGIQAKTYLYQPFASLRLGVEHCIWLLRYLLTSLVQMITGRTAPEIMGPVGIIHLVGEVARTGLMNLISLAAIISLNLGVINLLPIPALDGSRLLFLTVEGLRGRPIDPHKESFVHFIGFTLLIVLMIVIAYRDIMNIFY
ncbi:MAG: RIP metalloprotease RseP [Firmicutes bacterium]|nr:RIP metalloprotease RseP [Bacillota bacterium]